MAADPQLVEAVKKLTWQMVWPAILIVLGFGLLETVIVLIKNKMRRKKRQQDASIEKCPRCGGALLKREGKFGDFLGCTNYPKCKYTKNI